MRGSVGRKRRKDLGMRARFLRLVFMWLKRAAVGRGAGTGILVVAPGAALDRWTALRDTRWPRGPSPSSRDPRHRRSPLAPQSRPNATGLRPRPDVGFLSFSLFAGSDRSLVSFDIFFSYSYSYCVCVLFVVFTMQCDAFAVGKFLLTRQNDNVQR